MNRMVRTLLSVASVATAFALVPAGIAVAQAAEGDSSAEHSFHRGHGHPGLIEHALHLSSLTPDQRATVERLASQAKAAAAPVRQATAVELTELAREVEAGALDPAALAPSQQAKHGAAMSVRTTMQGLVAQLHDALTPAQRAELVDGLEAHASGKHPGAEHAALRHWGDKLGLSADQKRQIKANLEAERSDRADAGRPPEHEARHAWLEAFRADSFQPPAAAMFPDVGPGPGGDRIERVIQAALPVLTPAQRIELAGRLRAHAEHAARG